MGAVLPGLKTPPRELHLPQLLGVTIVVETVVVGTPGQLLAAPLTTTIALGTEEPEAETIAAHEEATAATARMRRKTRSVESEVR